MSDPSSMGLKLGRGLVEKLRWFSSQTTHPISLIGLVTTQKQIAIQPASEDQVGFFQQAKIF